MKTLLLALVSLVTSFTYAHGDQTLTQELVFAKGAVQAHATWLVGPLEGQESKLKIEWNSGADKSPIEAPGTFVVSLFMPGMGHGSAPTKIAQTLDANGQPLLGSYEVSNIYFIMGGDWDVKVSVTYPDGTTETQMFSVNLDM